MSLSPKRVLVVAGALSLAFPSSACGTAKATLESAPAGTAGTAGTALATGGSLAAPPGTEAATATFDVGRTVSYLGYTVRLGTFVYDAGAHTAQLDLDVTNTAEKAGSWSRERVQINGGGTSAVEHVGTQDIGPGDHERVKVTFADVDKAFRVDGATVEIGEPNREHPRVALRGSDGRTLQPVAQPVPAAVSAGTVTVTPSSVEVRWDDPIERSQAKAGTALLWVKATAVDVGNGDNFGFHNASLVAPDGTKVAAEHINEILGGGESDPITMSFDLPGAFAGTYQLEVSGPFGAKGAFVSARVPLVLQATPPADVPGTTPGTSAPTGPGTTRPGGS